MAMQVDGIEIEERYTIYGVLCRSGDVIESESEQDAHMEQLLYEGSQVVVRQVFESAWAAI